jgi:hypothetical protein
MPTHKRLPKAATVRSISSIPTVSYHFWFSDNLTDWMCSNKNTQALRRKHKNEFAEHEQRVSDFKRKHG